MRWESKVLACAHGISIICTGNTCVNGGGEEVSNGGTTIEKGKFFRGKKENVSGKKARGIAELGENPKKKRDFWRFETKGRRAALGPVGERKISVIARGKALDSSISMVVSHRRKKGSPSKQSR